MRCISAAYVVMRCTSVCPSVTFVNCAKTNKDIFEIFSPSGSHTILVFPTKRHGNIRTGTPLTGTSNAGGVGQKRDSGRISGFAAYRSTVLSTVRVANCKTQSRDGRRRASSTPRRPSSVVLTRRRQNVCDGFDVIRRRGGQTLPDTTPLVITPVFCCRRTS